MKHIIAILFLLIYTSIAFSITIDFHYCQGKLVKYSIFNINKVPKCCCNDMAKSMADLCCKDEVKICKADTHKISPGVVAMNFVQYGLLLPVLPLFITHTNLQPETSVIITYSRFKRSPQPIYLLFQVFRI